MSHIYPVFFSLHTTCWLTLSRAHPPGHELLWTIFAFGPWGPDRNSFDLQRDACQIFVVQTFPISSSLNLCVRGLFRCGFIKTSLGAIPLMYQSLLDDIVQYLLCRPPNNLPPSPTPRTHTLIP